jgi:hypothetical protein
MRRDHEGRQRQGLRTIFKPLKEWYGKTDESQWTTALKISRDSTYSILHDTLNWRAAKLIKDATKNFFFSDEIKNLVKRWNRCGEVEGGVGIMLKSNISFVPVYLQ